MLLTILAFVPFIFLIYFLVYKELRASKVLFFTFLLTFFLLFFVWKQPFNELVHAILKGLFVTLDLFLIIFGVLLLFFLLQKTHHLQKLERYFLHLSSDIPVHIVFIGFFLVVFFEAIAGFGIPALIAAPLLVLVGVRPLHAVILTLISDSVVSLFGAFGTPVIIGLEALPISVAEVSFFAGLIGGIILLCTPFTLLFVYSRLTKKSYSRFTPFVLVSGLVSAVLFFLSAWFFGPEFPSVISSIGGFIIMFLLLRLHVFSVRIKSPALRPARVALLCYSLIILLLLLTRLNVFSLGDTARQVGFTVVFSESLGHTLSLFSPGALILLSVLFCIFFLRPSKEVFFSSLRSTKEKSFPVILTLVWVLLFAQLVMHSSDPSLPSLIAGLFAHSGWLYVFIAPILGAFGSFSAGGATISTLMFSGVQLEVALLSGFSPGVILALQLVGAGIGNMLAIHNLVAVLTVVHLSHGIPVVIKANIRIALLFCLLASLFAFILLLFV